jgi:hypothetical protein
MLPPTGTGVGSICDFGTEEIAKANVFLAASSWRTPPSRLLASLHSRAVVILPLASVRIQEVSSGAASGVLTSQPLGWVRANILQYLFV